MSIPSLAQGRAGSVPLAARAPQMGSAVRVWLATVALLVFGMIVVGGLTRLTDSGLSITEWQPLLGAIPPLNDADWQVAFTKYRAIPQYTSVNSGMTLDAFKSIFWWEWAHRFLGRFIGIALALPFAAFWFSGRLTARLAVRILAVTVLVGVQGAVGWYMVKSGLADRIDVSPYRLALHLSIAFLILGSIVWLVLDEAQPRADLNAAPRSLSDCRWATAVAALVFGQVALGGLVAGLKAGRAFNTWPLMDGRVIPDGYSNLAPWWLNLTENMAAVQFNHRLTAYALAILALWHGLRMWRSSTTTVVRRSAACLASGVFAQMTLGILTVVNAVPLGLGIAHQAMAAVVFVLAIWHVHATVESRGAMAVRT